LLREIDLPPPPQKKKAESFAPFLSTEVKVAVGQVGNGMSLGVLFFIQKVKSGLGNARLRSKNCILVEGNIFYQYRENIVSVVLGPSNT